MTGFRAAGLSRRLLAFAIDSGAGLAAVAVGYVTGLLNPAPFRVEAGWFWTEWWLRYWIEDPGIFLRPVVTLVIATWLWTVLWEFGRSRTPGDQLLRIEVVDEDGDRPQGWRIAVRAVAMLLSPMSLGLTWLLGFVSPARRTLHDVVSGTWVVRDT